MVKEENTYFHRIRDIAGKKEDDVLAELLASIEKNIGSKMTKRETRLLFTLITEIIQNVQKYAISDMENVFEIGYDEDQNVVITSKNFTTRNHADRINKIVEEIDGVNNKELEKKYDDLLKNAIPEKPSGGLGMMFLRANSITYRYKVDVISDDVYSVGLKILVLNGNDFKY